MLVKIERFLEKKELNCILGKVFVDGEFFCYSLENQWLDNERKVSCIPSGKYKTKLHNGKKYKNVAVLLNVPDRDYILIHWGNYHWDTLGCPIFGDSYVEETEVYDKKLKKNRKTSAVFNSRKTVKKFYEKVGYEFDIEIVNNFKKREMLPLLTLASPFASFIGKKLTKVAAKEILDTVENKTGIKITDQEDARQALGKLSSADLKEIETVALNADKEKFKAELENGEDLSKTFKDEVVTYSTFLILFILLGTAFVDPSKAMAMVETLKALMATPFSYLLLFVVVSAIGGKHIMSKIADKYLKVK